jgi:hypothetical protein
MDRHFRVEHHIRRLAKLYRAHRRHIVRCSFGQTKLSQRVPLVPSDGLRDDVVFTRHIAYRCPRRSTTPKLDKGSCAFGDRDRSADIALAQTAQEGVS